MLSWRAAVYRRVFCRGAFKKIKGVFGEDSLSNYQKVFDLVPLTIRGGPDDFEAEEKSPTTCSVKAVLPAKHGRVSTDGSVEERLAEVYYTPEGYWRGRSANPKLAKEAGVGEDVAHEWLTKQAICQIYLPALE